MDTKKETGYLGAIVSYGLDKTWCDGLFVKADEEREASKVYGEVYSGRVCVSQDDENSKE